MVDIKNKTDCCGCQVCGDICPKGSISFREDEEGIWYPQVNSDTCIECHLCEKVCPILNKVTSANNSIDPITYILQAPNTIDRLKSASGGAYSLLINEVFNRGGYVAGHIWNDKASVKGYISCKPEDLDILRGTKYLQSDVSGIYKAVKQLLNEGKLVLFSGCPCQIAAMRSFLKKDYDNLLMTDFVCMGIDSPLAFQKYIESLERAHKSTIVSFKAKSKEVGWRYLTNKAVFKNGESYFGINDEDSNLKATFLNVLVRPSCYECRFKGLPRISDITIGDYWRKTYSEDQLDDNTGTSYIMLHNDKAKRIFDSIKDKCHCRQSSITDILGANALAIHSLSRPNFSREEFYKRIHSEDFSSLVDEFFVKTKRTFTRFETVKSIIKTLIKACIYYRKHPLSFIYFLYYNYFSSKVNANIKKGNMLFLRNTKLKLGQNATIHVNGHCIIGSNIKTSIILGKDSVLSLNNNLIFEGSCIRLHDNASLNLGFKTIVGQNNVMNVSAVVSIGAFSYLDSNVIIDTTDSGIVYFDGSDNYNKDIYLGTHTLVNSGGKILSGTKIGDESIVLEYSVVKGVFKPLSVLSGCPANVIKNDLIWKHNFDFIWNYKN